MLLGLAPLATRRCEGTHAELTIESNPSSTDTIHNYSLFACFCRTHPKMNDQWRSNISVFGVGGCCESKWTAFGCWPSFHCFDSEAFVWWPSHTLPFSPPVPTLAHVLSSKHQLQQRLRQTRNSCGISLMTFGRDRQCQWTIILQSNSSKWNWPY